jgi:hypothetical protein
MDLGRNNKGQFVNGHIQYFSWKGKHFSKELRQKLSISHKNQHSSPKTEFKKGQIPWNKGKKSKLSGEKHYNWKGGLPKCLKCGKQL